MSVFSSSLKRLRSKRSSGMRSTKAMIERLEERRLLAFQVMHEPYLQLGDAPLIGSADYNGTDQVEVIWQTTGIADAGESFSVRYRVAGGQEADWVNAAAPTQAGNVTVSGQTRNNHSTLITGLTFNTSYEYEVKHDKPAPAADVTYAGTHITRLAPGDTSSFTFAAYGDSADGANPTGFRALNGALNTLNPRFTLNLGDNAYPSGTHENLEYRLNPASGFAGSNVRDFIRNHVEFLA